MTAARIAAWLLASFLAGPAATIIFGAGALCLRAAWLSAKRHIDNNSLSAAT